MSAVLALALAPAAAVLAAFAIDRYCGQPPARWHFVVWTGNYLNWVVPHVLPAQSSPENARDLKAFGLGALAWFARTALVLIAACAMQWGFLQLPGLLTALLLGLSLKPMLAWAMLRREVQAVEDAQGESLGASASPCW